MTTRTTKIEWAERTWNPVTGCTEISPGCKNCYAKRMSKRLAGRVGYPATNPFDITLHPTRLNEPLRWKKPSRIFVCSMGDLFHHLVPDKAVLAVLDAAMNAPQHTYIFLTKRHIIMELLIAEWLYCTRAVPPNWWLGVTTENQQFADKRLPHLLRITSGVTVCSIEPMLGPVILPDEFLARGKQAWVICGGETGPGARPMNPDWARGLRNQCLAAGVPFFFKKHGGKNSSRLLDGVEHNEFPAVKGKEK